MGDPWEGLTADGTIRTGADPNRIPDAAKPILERVIVAAQQAEPTASVYVYGSVSTGMARPPHSDVDVLTIGLSAEASSQIGAEVSDRFADRCRGVEIAAAQPSDFTGDGDQAYGGRVFLHHYCVHLAGPDLDLAAGGFAGDARAARGFNGDIAAHAARWRTELDGGGDALVLARRVGRKTLLAVAGLVSLHDATWTTDRRRAAHRWGEVNPELAAGLHELLTWSSGSATADRQRLALRLDTTVGPIVAQFAEQIGLWPA